MQCGVVAFWLAIVVLGAIPTEGGREGSDPTDGRLAVIKNAALDYIEGWFEGDVVRMERALHPELTKRGFVSFAPSGGRIINLLTQSNMLAYTRAGFGKKVPKDKRDIMVEVLHVYRDIATVVTTCSEFVDYLQLAKVDGRWKIVNVLWQPTEQADKRRMQSEDRKKKP